MKAYTDLEQSKKLAEILPVKSADMCYIKENWYDSDDDKWYEDDILMVDTKENVDNMIPQHITFPCWSLAALLEVIRNLVYFFNEDANIILTSYKTIEWYLEIDNSDIELVTEINPVDACYEMILILKEKDLL